MAFTAADVKTLRERTNVGMMDCKKALAACDGDMDKAIEWLREKGLAKAVKKSGRIAAEGMAYATVQGNVGAVVEVNCETDFCAKSAPFVEFVKGIAQVVVDSDPADVDALKKCPFPGTELTVEGVLPEKVMSIGENLQIRRFVRFNENTSVAYVHAGGKIGVLVNLAVEGDIDATEIGKNVAMQIAALNPRFWDKADVTADVLEEEKIHLDSQHTHAHPLVVVGVLVVEYIRRNDVTYLVAITQALASFDGTTHQFERSNRCKHTWQFILLIIV